MGTKILRSLVCPNGSEKSVLYEYLLSKIDFIKHAKSKGFKVYL